MGLTASLLDRTVIGNDQSIAAQLQTMLEAAGSQNPLAADFTPGDDVNRVKGESLGLYSNLHALRGFAAYFEKDGRAPDIAIKIDGYPHLKIVYESCSKKFAHLIDHADSSGYYLPIDFAVPFAVDYKGTAISVGSCQALLHELDQLGQPLFAEQIKTFKGPELLWELDTKDPFGTEKFVWCRLRWLLRNAIKFKMLIAFS